MKHYEQMSLRRLMEQMPDAEWRDCFGALFTSWQVLKGDAHLRQSGRVRFDGRHVIATRTGSKLPYKVLTLVRGGQGVGESEKS